MVAPLPADMEAALRSLRTRARVKRAEAGEKGEAAIFKPRITFEAKQDRIKRAKTHGKSEGLPSGPPAQRDPHVKREPKRTPSRPAGARAKGGRPSGIKPVGKPRTGPNTGRPSSGTRPAKPRNG